MPVSTIPKSRSSVDSEIESLASTHYTRLLHLASSAVGIDDAPDLVQSALFFAWRGRNKFRGDSSVYTWVCTILRNEALAHWRRIRRRPVTFSIESPAELPAGTSQPPDPHPGVFELTLHNERRTMLYNAIKGLPPEYKDGLRLWMANRPESNQAGNKTRAHRARKVLIRKLSIHAAA